MGSGMRCDGGTCGGDGSDGGNGGGAGGTGGAGGVGGKQYIHLFWFVGSSS